MAYLIVAVGVGVGCAFGSKAILTGKGYQESETTLYFWLGFFLGIIGLIIAAVQPAKNMVPSSGGVGSVTTADELTKYKELLDAGAITQEEFDHKKKELLNL